MEVEDGRLLVGGIHLPQHPARQRVGQQPEVAAAAGWQVAVEQTQRGDRDLDQPVGGLVREARRIGHAVVVVADRVDARAVAIARTRQTVERPQIARPDGKARCPVAGHLGAGQVFEHALGARDVGQERRPAEVAGAFMAIAMAGHFVPLADNAPHQLRVALGDPAQGEEGGFGVLLVEQREDAIDIAFDTAFALVPVGAGDVGSKCRDLEIVLDIDRQRVGDRSARHGSFTTWRWFILQLRWMSSSRH